MTENPQATIVLDDPIVIALGETQLIPEGVLEMARWIQRYRPQCVPEQGFESVLDLVPHDGADVDPFTGLVRPRITDNELLAELAGRKCYDSFAEAGKPRSNSEYLHSMWDGRIPHRSTGYHPQMTFFIAHVSRRVSHELIRNYVGHAKDEEGIPSQESTRFTHHPGAYIAHPHILGDEEELAAFTVLANDNYMSYVATIQRKSVVYERQHGKKLIGLDKKRIYESTAGDLLMQCGTSFIWTTNAMALTKLFHERDDEAADMEIGRFARVWKKVCFARWPNLFTDFHPKG
jgi:thymidylate synthase ThyX